MRFIFFVYFSICIYPLFGQYDYFDSELGYDSYKKAYSRLTEERIIGNVKELKAGSSSGIYLHLRLNKKGQIIESREYVDTIGLSRTTTFSNQKIIKETEYYGGVPRSYIFYKYDKSGNLIAKDFSKSKKNREPTTRITYQYDNNGRLILRNYHNKNAQAMA